MPATWLAEVLRSAGLTVVEHDGWRQRGNGEFTDLWAVVWHHDGSPAGASPNVPVYIAGQVDADNPGANCWVALDGIWHLIAAGMTYHAGKVLPGKPGNPESIGIETDHTTGETWSGVELLDSLRRGTAAILGYLGEDQDSLEFHKTICFPVGRKTDPDGLALTTERAAIAALLDQSTTSPQEALLMAAALTDDDARRALIRGWYLEHLGRGIESAKAMDDKLVLFKVKGADACLAAIVDSTEAIAYRKAVNATYGFAGRA